MSRCLVTSFQGHILPANPTWGGGVKPVVARRARVLSAAFEFVQRRRSGAHRAGSADHHCTGAHGAAR